MEKKGYVLALQDLAKIGQKYLCNSCTFVLREPVQTTCGHHYCRTCLDYLLSEPNGAKCLKDGNAITKLSVFPDACIAREVLSLTVHCLYVEDGCPWFGEVRVIECHLKECPYVRVACMFSSCGVLVKRSELASHLENDCSERVVICSYCEFSVPFSKLKVHERTMCKQVPETCGMCMKTNIPRGELKHHYDECEEVEKECEYLPIGCKDKKKMKKSERDNHRNTATSFHLNLLLVIVLLIKDRIQWVLQRIASFAEEVSILKRLRETVTEMMSQIAGLILSNTEFREELNSQAARTKALEDTYKVQNNREFGGGEFGGGEFGGGEFGGGEFLRQRNHNMDTTGDYGLLKRDFERVSQSLEDMTTRFSQLQRELDSQSQVIAMSSINMTEMAESIQQIESISYEGTLLWKITDFSKKRREAINGIKTSFYSPYFYSNRYGYKMCARVYLNGDGIGKGAHVSLFFVIVRGEHDALLRWPFREKVTMMILDHNSMEHIIDAFRPDPASSSFQRPLNEMNVASGCPLFCPLADLDKRAAYVKEDCMFVKVIVDKSSY